MRPHIAPRVFDGVAILAALAIKIANPPASWIETHYSNGAYPIIDRTVRALTGPIPFCVGDVLFVVAVTWLVRYWFVTLSRARNARWVAFARLVLRTLTVACAIFVWFELSWAYNYARVPLADKIVVRDTRTDEDTVAAFANRVVDRLSMYAAAAHRERADDATFQRHLEPTFAATIARLGSEGSFPPPRVKPTIFQPLMALSGSSGFTDPWTHEVNLDATALPVERPAIYAHEWAHIAGFADESEANFISVIACTTSHDPLLAYSGWILVWFNLPSDVRISHRMSKMAYGDIMAIRARYTKNVNTDVARVQQVAYDRYLRSNHVKAGYASYRLFIRWMTGAEFDARGLPRVRNVMRVTLRERPSGRAKVRLVSGRYPVI